MKRTKIRFGVIGLGLMGKEFCSAISRWCHLLDDGATPELKGICSRNPANWRWYLDNFPGIEIKTDNYKELIASEKIDAVYCAVPHNLHEQFYVDIINSGKHLLAEKPFGIDLRANEKIVEACGKNPGVMVRCSSEFPYFPACQRLIRWVEEGRYGKLIEVRAGFHHSSDMDLNKPLNWKRTVEINGEYGCMGDLGMHTLHVPFRMGWKPVSVYADLQNIADTRPDGKGRIVPCNTWDNAVLTCKTKDPKTDSLFSMVIETKRMAPGATNTWFIEVYGTEGSAKFSTHNPKAFEFLKTEGKEQGWTRTDIGSQSAIPTITGGIFEFGFSDAFLQMVAVFINEFPEQRNEGIFRTVTPEETSWSHKLFTAALESGKSGRSIAIDYE